jgi:predicted AlkP superfamily pyrophosphatase or phosphodiesterase
MKAKILFPDYTNSILNVTSTILKHYGADSIYPQIPVLEESLKVDSKHVLLVLLDGMGINIINKYLKPDDFLRKHVKKIITSVFPPTTVAATNAVLSGLPPYSSGYLGWIQYFKREKTNHVVFLDHDFYDEKRVFTGSLRDEYLKYQTIFEQIEAKRPDVKTYELFPSFRINGYSSFAKQVDYAIEITKKDETNFSYIYWTEPDMTQHDHGIDSKATKDMLVSLNKEVERLSQHVAKDTTMIVIADHGLTNVKGIDLFDNLELLSCLKRKPSIETRAATFFVKPFRKKRFRGLFNQA